MIWDTEELICTHSYAALEFPIRGLSFSHDGEFVAIASEDNDIPIVCFNSAIGMAFSQHADFGIHRRACAQGPPKKRGWHDSGGMAPVPSVLGIHNGRALNDRTRPKEVRHGSDVTVLLTLFQGTTLRCLYLRSLADLLAYTFGSPHIIAKSLLYYYSEYISQNRQSNEYHYY
jgi:hypothetical protein